MVFFLVLQHCFIISKGRKVVVKAKKISELYRLTLQLQIPILGSLFATSKIGEALLSYVYVFLLHWEEKKFKFIENMHLRNFKVDLKSRG